ncbi:biotin--[acetyl-CoA-carboxylase] ligase [Aliibacillus thermotolerans]|uniref:Bifunctional ligase/repressor BirA n=1 Tax=Aliibacillus thermotolerans TaxID=1834418 RepID=A0ABW0U697_9BACI|nr:biotin--[acetyl-CoA-carboxylase] ligase [Aliibacillus thermotolerans]MDA3130168.1 biotin--[acetyl-CoA-carboxylase] ligase [Aliibacillus thermotolerans]
MRGKLLQLLSQSKDRFLSGQQISDMLHISRTAVWKHIEELRKNGYEIEAVPRKGYRLRYMPNLASTDEIKSKLQTKAIGRHIVYKKEVTSTQDIAHQLVQEGAEEGTIVIADKQTKGKGRLGRPWHSMEEKGLWFSIILRPDIPPQVAPQLTLLTAVAVQEGLERATDLPVEIKWPNDILLRGKKIAGILTEMHSELDRIQAIVVGIGLNVNQQKTDFPEELSAVATSLSMEANGKVFQRSDVIVSVLEKYEHWYYKYLDQGFFPIKKRWEQLATTIGKEITAKTMRKEVQGIAEGITDEGVLLIRKKDGTLESVYSADID